MNDLNNSNKKRTGDIVFAVLAAALYGLSTPFSKLLLAKLSPTFMAAMLYLGAGIGMLFISIYRRAAKKKMAEAKITKAEFPFVVGTIVLDIAAPIFLMIGLALTTSANASLLGNFEIVATAIVALAIFGESIGKKMWVAIGLVTLASIILSIKDLGGFKFSAGSLLVLLACVCWGFENNFTRKISIKDPLQIVIIKGIASGIGTLIVCVVLGQVTWQIDYIIYAAMLGFVAYGLSIYFYIKAQRQLGAARTSAYYAIAPFVGVAISFILLNEPITWSFVVALIVMIAGVYLAVKEKHKHLHIHEAVTHEHAHSHDELHHNHEHIEKQAGEHNLLHTHQRLEHKHEHNPDTHHRHKHR